ncbi:MAG TPA: hypothetical protein VNK94_07405 [Gaiellaceae bacterium]|nr:hypothetical protein [Gaiellaceae bacterium]
MTREHPSSERRAHVLALAERDFCPRCDEQAATAAIATARVTEPVLSRPRSSEGNV